MATRRTPKTKEAMHTAAHALAEQFQLVRHNSQLFVPVAWSNPVVDKTLPVPEETVWLPMTPEDILEFGGTQGHILFQNAAELNSFGFMLMQQSARPTKLDTDEVLIKTAEGLRVLTPQGLLVDPEGIFIPNLLWPQLNTDADVKDEVFKIMVDWLGAEDPVHSLLYHLATALAPGWSAGKLILLLGKGRNGKSTLLKMLEKLLGSPNVSHVTRQQMAAREPSIVDLNNKLANIVYDAEASYLRDSSTEKTLVVGEIIGVRMLYANTNTSVWTNGLFIEGLQEEPKSRDKSNALQRRLVRFYFPKEYPLNRGFEEYMLSEKILGAFLSLLLDHYVTRDRVAELLIPSQASYDLQVEQMWTNSKPFQWVHELVSKDPANVDRIIGSELDSRVGEFHAWLMNGKDDYSSVDALRMLKEVFLSKRVSRRDGKDVRKVYVIEGFTPDAARMVEQLTEEGDDDGVLDDGPLVDD